MKSKKNRIISFCLVMCMVMLMIPFTYFTSTAAEPAVVDECNHEWLETTRTEATCTDTGLVVHTCSLCGKTEETILSALGHNYVSDVCSRCGDWLYTAISEYNSSTGDVFLGGKYIELGISKHGSFGTSTAPQNSAFHSDGELGMIVDGDGWDIGNAPTTGDFFLPDTPEERYIFSYYYNGTKYEYIFAERNGKNTTTSWSVPPTVSNQSSGNKLAAVVYGVTQHNVVLEITYSFNVNDKNFKTEVKVTNKSGLDVTNVRFVRSFDPDQDDDKYDTNNTYNKVLANPDASKVAGDTNYAMVVARGYETLDGFFFVAFDNRAYASQGVAFAPGSAYLDGLWKNTHSYANYATEESIAMTKGNLNGYSCDDTGIAITFNLGTVTADGKDSFEYYSSMSPNVDSDLDVLLPASQPIINSVNGAQIAHSSVGEGPSINAIVEEGHTISYQWYINDENTNVGGTAIPGAASANYEISNKYAAGTVEYYYCIVKATRIDNGLQATIVSDAVMVEYLGNTHTFEETSRTEATCTTNGRIDYACSCGETKTEILIATGHSIETVVETEVTCTSDGLIIDRCTNGGCDYEKRTVIHGSHDYSVSDRKEAACEVPGYVEYTCGNCGDKQYEYFDGMHNYVETSRVEAQVGVEGSITYTCTACNDSYTINIPALAPVLKNSAVLLIQDTLPWAENVNTSLLNVLKDRGVVSSYNIINTSALASVDLTQYGVVFIANDQTTGMYERLAANSEKLENYVRAGGNLIYGACDEGWGGCGSLTHTLPGGVTTSNYYSVHNYIVNELHPIVTGVNTDNRSLKDELLKGNYCSHTYFNTATLPEGTDIILRDANGNPTLVEYSIGDGTVIASGLTWEYFYIREHYNMVTNYSKYAFDDLLTYMIYMSNTCEHNYEIAETVAPTCEENGYTKYVCTLCSHEYMGNVVIATGHTHTETSRTEAGCTVNGEIVYTCACGDVKTEVIAATGHTWELESRTDATCTEYGEIIYGCENCLATRNELLEPVGHQYEIVNTVEPTCTTDGHIDFACQSAGCEATKQQLLASLGHTYGYDNVCDRCGHTIEIHTHSYTANTVAPTCTAMGYTEYTCSCGHSYKDSYVEPTRHTWDEGVVTVAASCTSDGYITYSCLDCEAEKTVIISAGHNWSETVTVEKTCTQDGLKTKTCSVCGETETEIIPAGHEWNAGVEIVAATCEGEGSRLSGCLQCGETQTFVIAPLGHNYVDGVCTRCGEEFIDNITASEHPIYGMYFEIDGVVSDYGPSIIDEYGVFLYHNSDAVIEKVAVYLTQDGTMWRRCIAVKGTNIQYAVYVPYLSYGSDIKYTGLNHDWINVFHLSETYNDVWCYSDFVTIGANLEDANGNLLLTLYDIGQAGAETLIFDDLDAMKVWLYDECIHTPSDWIVDSEPTVTEEGRKHRECTKCGEELASCAIAKIPQIIVEAAQAPADSLVTVAVDIANNPGVLGAILKVEYDDALTLVSAEAGDAWRTLNLTLPGSFAPSCSFVWDGTSEEDLSSGTILILTFRVSADAEPGDVYNVSVSYTPGNIIDADLNPVEIGITNGSVTVVEDFVSGDLSGDGEIGIDDVVLLRRLIAGGYDLSDVNMLAADVNKDGKVNVIDVILIRRYIAGGYDVELE